eukprot:scaffold4617_cov106-Cylindrotheca_fusiformis.AAC.3
MNWLQQKKAGQQLYRSWNHSYNTKSDPEILKLEDESHKARLELNALRERGNQKRLRRLQELDALEIRRVTLSEILKRMEKELKEKDVHYYGDVLAEVFGQRKIYAHRAIGLESLLCQMMHQMLAKQHQLKIVKQFGKIIQQFYKQHKIRNKDEFHSYSALAVQLEAARLSLLAMYDEIFAQQHRVLAMVKDLRPEGTVANYTIPNQKKAEKPTLFVSTKHQISVEDLASPESLNSAGDRDDYESAMDVLEEVSLASGRKRTPLKVPPDGIFRQTQTSQISQIVIPSTNKDPNVKTARERRREIEQLRQARVLGPSPGLKAAAPIEEEPDVKSHRERMRELEAVRTKLKTRVLNFGDEETNRNAGKDGVLRTRGAHSPRKSSSRNGSPRKLPPSRISPRKASPGKDDDGGSKPQSPPSVDLTEKDNLAQKARGDDRVIMPHGSRSPNSVSESINESDTNEPHSFA